MESFFYNLIDKNVQCVACPVFDRLFQVVSESAGVIYSKLAQICLILFFVMFAFYVLVSVWKNFKSGIKDPWYENSLKKVIINSLVSLTFLSAGILLPRLVSMVTFEPAANIALTYTESMLQIDSETINEKVTYTPEPMADDGIFRPDLRDSIIMLMKTTITQFQSYMKIGLAIIDTSLSWSALMGIGNFIKHLVFFFIGVFLFWNFFKLFLRFCFYFMDIIVAMASFAFFFPLSLLTMSFKGASDVPKWISGFGSSLGAGQIKKLINSIITLVSGIITYTIIMVIISSFFSMSGQSATDLLNSITNGTIYAPDLSPDAIETLTLGGCIVLVYVLNFIMGQIPQIKKMILDAFDVKEEETLSKGLADSAEKLIKNITTKVEKTTAALNPSKDANKK